MSFIYKPLISQRNVAQGNEYGNGPRNI